MHTQEQPTNRLAELREARGEKRYHVAALVDRDPVTVGRWERGLQPIPSTLIPKLAQHYEVSPAHLMRWDDEPEAA